MTVFRRLRFYYPWIFLVALTLYFCVTTPLFRTGHNFVNISSTLPVTGLYALGITIVFIGGGVDLSMITVGAGTAMMFARLFEEGVSTQGALTIAFFYAAGLGLINGLLVTKGRIAPFVATLASSQGFNTVTDRLGHSVAINNLGLRAHPPDEFFGTLGEGTVWVVPVQVIIYVGVALGSFFLLAYTVFGNHLYATGSNPGAARLSGVNVDRIRISTYVLCALFAGMAALIEASYRSHASQVGWSVLNQGQLLSSIGAALIGGTSLVGGVGSIQGTVAGSMIIAVLANGFIWGTVPKWGSLPLSSGGVILGAVAVGWLLSHTAPFRVAAARQRLADMFGRIRSLGSRRQA